jgi:hypothetical protein
MKYKSAQVIEINLSITKFFYIVFLINSINAKSCGDFIPTVKTECFEYSNILEYCCHLSNESGDKGCGKINVAEYPTFRGVKYYNNVKYNYDCGSTYTKNDSIACGTNPVTEFDCYKNSTIDNSCCYYNYGGYKGCMYYGNKINGSLPFGVFILKCSSSYITYSITFILLVFLI